MHRSRLVKSMMCCLLGGIAVMTLPGCYATGAQYGYSHRIDPYAGRENEAAMSAFGAMLRPHSKVGPQQTEEALQGLRGLGVLMDLANR